MCLITRTCIGMISSCSLVSSPITCLRQPHSQVSSCSGSSWMTSTRGSSAGSGLRLPRRLVGATTSSSISSAEASGAASARLSASLNISNCGESGSALCSDLRPNRRWISSAFCSRRCSICPSLTSISLSFADTCSCSDSRSCFSKMGSSGRGSGTEIMPWIIPAQVTKRGVSTLCGWLPQRSIPSSNWFNSRTVSSMASSPASGLVLKRSASRRLSHKQKPLRCQ